eukprot:257761-Pelagomonas_calceolata.AAC.2
MYRDRARNGQQDQQCTTTKVFLSLPIGHGVYGLLRLDGCLGLSRPIRHKMDACGWGERVLLFQLAD